MGSFINDIKYKFRQKNILIQLIIINGVIFLVLVVAQVIPTLFKLDSINLIDYLGVSSDIHILLKRPWTLFTYMVIHQNLWHILFNMLMLFWFGQLFLTYFSPKNLGSLYLLGGLAGAVLYIVAFNAIPYYVEMNHPFMIGASASVTAIIFGVAFYNPNLEVRLFFLGGIKIVYIAVFIFILDFISLGDASNPGGHVAHIGGAILGYVYAMQYLKGKDITRWMTRAIDFVVNLTKPKSERKIKMKVKYKKTETYNQHKQQPKTKPETEEIDRILDKIKASGYSSLSADEKKRLFDASKK